MDTRQMEYIIQISEERSITKAAEKLFITQSALNQQLQKLEKELGLPLFVRTRSDWHLTPAGEIYINTARQILNLKKEREVAKKYIRQMNIVCTGPDIEPLYLSGGNQQKVVIGKWLFTESDVLIFDEPTRGIDVGAREEIYHIIDDLAKKGTAILVISSDLPEVLTISDRIYVMREGRIAGELNCDSATQELIMGYASGGRE